MTKVKIEEAITLFDSEVVSEVMEIVNFSDADGAYTMCEDMGKYEHAECIQYLYFEE